MWWHVWGCSRERFEKTWKDQRTEGWRALEAWKFLSYSWRLLKLGFPCHGEAPKPFILTFKSSGSVVFPDIWRLPIRYPILTCVIDDVDVHTGHCTLFTEIWSFEPATLDLSSLLFVRHQIGMTFSAAQTRSRRKKACNCQGRSSGRGLWPSQQWDRTGLFGCFAKLIVLDVSLVICWKNSHETVEHHETTVMIYDMSLFRMIDPIPIAKLRSFPWCDCESFIRLHLRHLRVWYFMERRIGM